MSVNINKNKLSINNRYRPEIDGLRAFAVVAVIINHFNKDILPGGCGVDVFCYLGCNNFVSLSDLVKTSGILLVDFTNEESELVPALSVFVLITSIAICLFRKSLSIFMTSLTSLFGLSNLYL